MIDRLKLLGRTARWLPRLARAGPRSRATAADLVELRARRGPEDVFLRFEGRSLSYGSFNADANRVAHWLLAQGFGPGDVIALLMENRPEFLRVWAGAAKAGVTTALLNSQLEGEPLDHALRAASPRLLVAGRECAGHLQSLSGELRGSLPVYLADDPGSEASGPGLPDAKSFDEEVGGYSPRDPDPRVREAVRGGDPLFYIYTSGTTGLPKAARFSHARFAGGGLFSLLAGFGRHDTMYCCLPLYHTVGGVMCVNAALASGGTLALARHFSAHHFWDDVVEMKATAFQYVGELCRYLVAQPTHPREREHGLRMAVGNGLRPDVWEAFAERFRVPRIVEFYGATEANVTLVNLEGRTGSVGKPPTGIRVALARYDVERNELERDEKGRCIRCAPGEVGELLGRIRDGRTAAGRFEGYTSKEASERKVLRDAFAPGDAWFRSGDLLRRDEEGFYFFVDRIGDTFRWKGENVSTEEVERALRGWPEVETCSVYGVRVPEAEGRAGMAALVLREGAPQPDLGSLYEHVAAALPGYARPAFVRFQERPTLTSTLKLRKVELQREGFDVAQFPEPVVWRDDESRRYRPLDPETLDRIRAGGIRL